MSYIYELKCRECKKSVGFFDAHEKLKNGQIIKDFYWSDGQKANFGEIIRCLHCGYIFRGIMLTDFKRVKSKKR